MREANIISEENKKQGTYLWQLQYTHFDNPAVLVGTPLIRRLRSVDIEGYVSKTSFEPGDSVDFMVSMFPAGNFKIDIYRMGFYNGAGGRLMASLGSYKAETQEVPFMGMERIRQCRWEKSATFKIPNDWPSGVYLGKLTRDEEFGCQSYVIFVVKEKRKVDVLVQVSDLTWQSYNKWPSNDSIYQDGTTNPYYSGSRESSKDNATVRVSFDRPYAKYQQVMDVPQSIGSGEFLLWEFPLVYWLEENGYDVKYCSNIDIDEDPSILDSAKVFISSGHDEYWSYKMFEEVKKARDNGLSIAFLSGNSVGWDIEFYDSNVTGEKFRGFSRKRGMPNEDELMGVKTYGPGYGDWVVTDENHWVYENTKMVNGDRIVGIIGFEHHGTPADIAGLEVIATSPLYGCQKERLSLGPHTDVPVHHGIIYPGGQGGWVFNAGSVWWNEGLSNPPGHIPARTPHCGGTLGVDDRVQKITSNVLNRMIIDSNR